jgi:hypothetical protein
MSNVRIIQSVIRGDIWSNRRCCGGYRVLSKSNTHVVMREKRGLIMALC